MPAVAFDTLEESRRLAEDGIATKDAEAITAHSSRIVGGLATREDLQRLEERIEKDIRLVGLEISAKISSESNATFLRMIWVVGLGVAAIVGFIGVLTYFPPLAG